MARRATDDNLQKQNKKKKLGLGLYIQSDHAYIKQQKATQIYKTKPTRTCMLNLAITITITKICLSSPTRTCLQNVDGNLKSYTCLLLQHEFTKFTTGHHLSGVTHNFATSMSHWKRKP